MLAGKNEPPSGDDDARAFVGCSLRKHKPPAEAEPEGPDDDDDDESGVETKELLEMKRFILEPHHRRRGIVATARTRAPCRHVSFR